MIKRASLLTILLASLLPAAGAAQDSRPLCFLDKDDPTPSQDTTSCPEAEAVFTLEGMLDLTLDPSMVDPGVGTSWSVKTVSIACAICNGPSCDADPASGSVASQTHDVEGQTTVQVPYKVWFGREGRPNGGLLVDPADIDSYNCKIWVSYGGANQSGGFVRPSPFYTNNDLGIWAKVMDTPTPVLELSGTIN